MKNSKKPNTKNVVYRNGEWLKGGRKDGGLRSLEVHNRANSTRMWVAGEYITKDHSDYIPGRYDSWEQVKYPEDYKKPEPVKPVDPLLDKLRKEDKAIYAESDNKQSLLTEGFVYVIIHPKFGVWSKVGHSRDPERRLSSYNTGCPKREYELVGYELAKDRMELEKKVHGVLEAEGFPRQGEWFNCPPEYALEIIRGTNEQEIDCRHRDQRPEPVKDMGGGNLRSTDKTGDQLSLSFGHSGTSEALE